MREWDSSRAQEIAEGKAWELLSKQICSKALFFLPLVGVFEQFAKSRKRRSGDCKRQYRSRKAGQNDHKDL